MENFPQYKLWDFYGRHYYQGGLHYFQVQKMYEHIMDRKYNEHRFMAGIHGIDLDKELRKQGHKTQSEQLDDQQKKQDVPLFKDPDEYDNMSEEEKERLTNQMMKQHKDWVQKGSTPVGSG